MNYLGYWKLKDKPFENTKNSKFFYPTKNHVEALERLLYITRDRNMNFGLLTGEIGSGKTITKTVLEHQLLREDFEVVSIENSCFPFHSLLIEIVSQLKNRKMDIMESYDDYTTINMLKELLVHIVIENNRHLVILLDEAQQLDRSCLDKIKNLTNICSEDENYMTIILIGQPELRHLVRSLPQLDQRISLRYHLRHLSLKEVKGYIYHRLKTSGQDGGTLFSDEAINLIYQGSRGIPREINRTCRLALDSGFSLGLNTISDFVLRAILNDFHFQNSSSENSGKSNPMVNKSASCHVTGNEKYSVSLNGEKPGSKKLLIMGDSPDGRNSLSNILTHMGYSVTQAQKKDGFLERLSKLADLLLIRFNFKKKLDRLLFQRLVKSKDLKGTPMLFVFDPYSSQILEEKMGKINKKAKSFLRLLLMPFREEELKHKVERLLQRE